MATRVCLVGRRKLLLAGLTQVLSANLFEIVGLLDGLHEIGDTLTCDLIVVDCPSDVNALAPDILAMKSAYPQRPIVVMSDAFDSDQVSASFALGVDGYLLEDMPADALCESLRLVVMGEKILPSKMVALLARRPPQEPTDIRAPHDLSERELDIVSRLASGLPNKVIAFELSIAEATVKAHLKSILKKLGLANRTQAAVWALNHGFCDRQPGWNHPLEEIEDGAPSRSTWA